MILYSAFFIEFLLSRACRFSVGFGVRSIDGVGFGVGFDVGFLALLAVVIEVVTTCQSVALHGYRHFRFTREMVWIKLCFLSGLSM